MRHWVPAETELVCGGCRQPILKGEEHQQVRVPNVNVPGWVSGARHRCRSCSDDSPELQRDVTTVQAPLGVDFTRLLDVDTPLTRDWKALKAGAL
jgi:hypothetical protein